MRLSRLFAVAIAAAAFAAVAPNANAASDYFLKVDGVSGETTQTGLTGYIDIDTFKWSTEQLSTISTTGSMTAGKAQFNELEVTKPVDTTTPLLFQKLASGQVINTVEVLARKTATAPYLRYCFQKVLISKQEQAGDDDMPRETLNFRFIAGGQQVTRQNADGTMGASVFGGWDLRTNSLIQSAAAQPSTCSRA